MAKPYPGLIEIVGYWEFLRSARFGDSFGAISVQRTRLARELLQGCLTSEADTLWLSSWEYCYELLKTRNDALSWEG